MLRLPAQDLGIKRSDRFRARVNAAYDAASLGPACLELLEEIVLAMDQLAEIRASLKGSPLVDRLQGGDRPHPLLVEERLRSAALTSLLAQFPPRPREAADDLPTPMIGI